MESATFRWNVVVSQQMQLICIRPNLYECRKTFCFPETKKCDFCNFLGRTDKGRLKSTFGAQTAQGGKAATREDRGTKKSQLRVETWLRNYRRNELSLFRSQTF